MPSLHQTIRFPDGTSYDQPTGLFINNEFVASSAAEKVTSINPHDEREIVSVHAATKEDVDRAVKAARWCYENVYSLYSPPQIGGLLLKLASIVEQNSDLLSKIDALDGGKPFESNAKNDLNQIVEILTYYAGYADKIDGKYINLGPDKYVVEVKEPFGVVGLIVPWNYPLAMSIWKLVSALTAGNCIVIKSSEITPLSLLYLAKLVKEAGFPPGCFNVVSGLGSVTGAALASHLDVDKISFTGSTVTGQVIQKLASENLKNVTLECGGKSPCVVFKDANLDEAVKWSSLGIFYNSGQNCTANSRILVEDEIYDKFLAKFKEYVQKNWIVGAPFSEKSTVGPVVSKAQYDKVRSYIKHGSEVEGLKKLIGDEPVASNGYYVNPTIFVDVPETSRLFQEEIFGPVGVVTKFSGFNDALAKSNNSSYGLGSAVFTRNIKKAHRFSRGLKAGTVWINSSNDEDIRAAFGGYKMSGIGRELGSHGIDVYTQIKAIHVNLEVSEGDEYNESKL